MDADGRPFSQNVHTRNISDRGAQFYGLEKQLTPGDTIGVQFAEKKGRCKVIWAVDAGPVRKIEVGVKMVEGQPCPWQKEMTTLRASGTAPMVRTAPPPKDQRKFPRHRIPFPIEIRDGQSAGTHINTTTADIGGGGCYIETMLSLPVGKTLDVSFRINSTQVHTSAIVRTSDGGVGMGIEFTGLDEASQKQLQEHIESLAADSAPFPGRPGRAMAALFSRS
jgi:hypothetical protein